MNQYNLVVFCVDGETIFSCISADKKTLRDFIRRYDHEGSTLGLSTSADGKDITDLGDDPEFIYKELDWDEYETPAKAKG